MIAELDRLLQSQYRPRGRLVAKLFGGASMFGAGTIAPGALNVGQMNQDAAERILQALRIPILARDLGGASGRHLTFDVASGMVAIKIPGGADYEL
jgi:chemotaxis protein CheD